MIPQGLTTLISFLVLVAPGLLFELRRERRRPTLEETAFREASRIAFTSFIFSLLSVIVLTFFRSLQPEALPDPGRWLSDKSDYVAANYALVARFAVLEVGLALSFAFVADLILLRRATGNIVPGSIWFQVFRLERPKGKVPWVGVRLIDRTEFFGYLKYYTPEQKLENREIALQGDVNGKSLVMKTSTDPPELVELEDWRTVVIRGDQIQMVKVTYMEEASPPSRGDLWHFLRRAFGARA